MIPDTEVQVWVAKHSQKPAPIPTAAVGVKSATITPHESTIRLDQTLNFAAAVIETNGSPLDEASLSKIKFGWVVSPQTAASISANGSTAVLTPREPGPLHVVCVIEWIAPGRDQSAKRTFFPKEALVNVLPSKETARKPDKQPPPPPTAAEDPCTRLERLFLAAMDSNDFKTAASILVDSKECPFAKKRIAALNQNKEKQCSDLYGEIQAAIRNKDRYLAATLFEKGRQIGCNFPESMLQDKHENRNTWDPGELEGRWRITHLTLQGGMIVQFRKTSENTYVGILEANPENKPCWVKPGEQWFRATRMGANTYKFEVAEFTGKEISPGKWGTDYSSRRWLWGEKTFIVNGDTAGMTERPQYFFRIK